MTVPPEWKESVRLALQARRALLDADRKTALRLFNGFSEGCPKLTADLYGSTLLLQANSEPAEQGLARLAQAQELILSALPGIACVVQKVRSAGQAELRKGRISLGGPPDSQISEQGLQYAIDLRLNQDASFYLDTRLLRAWLRQEAAGWRVLNTFAYTGSLGVAALAGGAAFVVQVDLNRNFLQLARRSAMLNRLDLSKMRLVAANFFSQAAAFKRSGTLFDCVIVDPPFFSTTNKGVVDLANESARLINKARPLVKDGGRLIVINNALYLSGAQFMQTLEKLCASGYLAIDALLPVPPDITGFAETIQSAAPADPAPFNHPTKIVILSVKRKSQY